MAAVAVVVLQCGISMTTHMYLHRRSTRGIRLEASGGMRASSLFGFVPSVSVAIPPPFLGRRTIAPSDGGGGMADREERPRHSRPAEKFVLVWLVILIFLVLCQTGRASYLCDQPTNPAVSDWGAFFWSWFGLLADGTAGMLLLMMMVMTMARAAAGRVLYRFKQSSFRNRRHPWPGQCCHVLTSGAACPVGWEYADQMRFFQARRLRELNVPA